MALKKFSFNVIETDNLSNLIEITAKNIKLIYDLVKVKGFKIEGAKKKLQSSKNIIQVVKKLEKIKEKLINIEKEL